MIFQFQQFSEDQQSSPVTITPFQNEIMAGYDTAPWFGQEQNTKKLSKVDGRWMRGRQIRVPEHQTEILV